MKVLMQMGIPTIWNPSEKEEAAAGDVFSRDDLTYEVKNLLVGTESDPHYYHVRLDEQNEVVELDESVSIINLDVEEDPEKDKQEVP